MACKSKAVLIDKDKILLKDVPYDKELVTKGEVPISKLPKLKEYLKNHFSKNLNALEYLTIYSLSTEKECWNNTSDNINSRYPVAFFDDSKRNMNSNLLVTHHGEDFKSNFSKLDSTKLIYRLFNKGITECDYTVTLNKNGKYYVKKGLLDTNLSNAFVNELKRKKN